MLIHTISVNPMVNLWQSTKKNVYVYFPFIATKKSYRIKLPIQSVGDAQANPFQYDNINPSTFENASQVASRSTQVLLEPESPAPGRPDCWHRRAPGSGTSACLETNHSGPFDRKSAVVTLVSLNFCENGVHINALWPLKWSRAS